MTTATAPPDIDDASFVWTAFDAFEPAEQLRTIDWAVENAINEFGRPFDLAAYPHTGAPGGPFDAWDDPRVRELWLQYGTRLGKTFGSQICFQKAASTDPGPMLFASSTEQLSLRVTERFYKMLRGSRVLSQLLVKGLREQRQNHVEMRGCDMRIAWARSPSTLGDLTAKFGHANEIDKWEHVSTSKEAHPLKLFADRFKDVQAVRKVVYEGTPTIRGRSPIERGRLSGWNCRYFVPCPRCGRYQRLDFGDPETPHGVKWTKSETGKSDPDVAFRTAHYVCAHCAEPMGSANRSWSMRRGVWIPEGATVRDEEALEVAEQSMVRHADVAAIHSAIARDAPEATLSHDVRVSREDFDRAIEELRSEYVWEGWEKAPWIDGEPLRSGPIASYHLSSLYALSLTWGDVAREFVSTKDRPALLRNFITQWLANTWEIADRSESWEKLAERIIIDVPRLVVPRGYSLCTIGIDKQEDFYVWNVDAWRPPIGDGPPTSHTVAYGYADDEDALDDILTTKFAHEDGGPALSIACGLLDSGFRPKDVYRFCRRYRRRPQLLPCKGSSTKLDGYYRRTKLGKNTSSPGQRLVLVDTVFTQDHLDGQLYGGGTTLHSGSLDSHEDFLVQLQNDAAVPTLDKTNNVAEKWQRIDETIPNDFRDAKRYALVAMLAFTRGGRIRPRKVKPAVPEVTSLPANARPHTPVLAPTSSQPSTIPRSR